MKQNLYIEVKNLQPWTAIGAWITRTLFEYGS